MPTSARPRFYTRQDMVELIDRNTPGYALDFRSLRAALAEHYLLEEVDPACLKFEPGSESLDPALAHPEKGPIVVGEGNLVIDGRHRALAARKRGDRKIAAFMPSDPPRQVMARKAYFAALDETGPEIAAEIGKMIEKGLKTGYRMTHGKDGEPTRKTYLFTRPQAMDHEETLKGENPVFRVTELDANDEPWTHHVYGESEYRVFLTDPGKFTPATQAGELVSAVRAKLRPDLDQANRFGLWGSHAEFHYRRRSPEATRVPATVEDQGTDVYCWRPLHRQELTACGLEPVGARPNQELRAQQLAEAAQEQGPEISP